MRQITTLILALFISLFGISQDDGNDLYNSPKPYLSVIDSADILTVYQERKLADKISTFTYQTDVEVRLVTVHDAKPWNTASEFALDLFHEWELGTKDRHDGLLFVYAQNVGSGSNDPRDLCRIVTGFGIQKVLSDSMVILNIKRQYMIPEIQFKAFDAFDKTLDRTFELLTPLMNQPKPVEPAESVESSEKETGWTWDSWQVWLIIGIIALVLLIWYIVHQSSKDRYSSSGSSGSTSSGGGFFGFFGCSSGSSSCGSGCGGGGCGGGGCSS